MTWSSPLWSMAKQSKVNGHTVNLRGLYVREPDNRAWKAERQWLNGNFTQLLKNLFVVRWPSPFAQKAAFLFCSAHARVKYSDRSSLHPLLESCSFNLFGRAHAKKLFAVLPVHAECCVRILSTRVKNFVRILIAILIRVKDCVCGLFGPH